MKVENFRFTNDIAYTYELVMYSKYIYIYICIALYARLVYVAVPSRLIYSYQSIIHSAIAPNTYEHGHFCISLWSAARRSYGAIKSNEIFIGSGEWICIGRRKKLLTCSQNILMGVCIIIIIRNSHWTEPEMEYMYMNWWWCTSNGI